MKNLTDSQSIQGVLSVGYIYLILMGILNETLFYNQIDIDILSYSSIIDVLISPISKLTTSKAGFGFFLFFLLLLFILPSKLAKKHQTEWFKKTFKTEHEMGYQDAVNLVFKSLVFVSSMGLFGFYVGTGAGAGYKLTQKIKENKLDYKDTIYFTNGDISQVELVGKNSTYLFYMTKGKQTVLVTPISGVVKAIEEVEE